MKGGGRNPRKIMRRLHFVGVVSTLLLATAQMRAEVVSNSSQQPASASQPAAEPFQSPDVYAPGASGLTPPRLLKEVKPSYTGDAIRARIQGVVRLECIVELDGTVGATRVVKSLDSAFGLDNEALRTVKQWRFVPGVKDGTPVRTLVQVELSFTLRSNRPPTLDWPDLFATKPGEPEVSRDNWVDDVASASGLTIKFAYPPGWILAKGDHPQRLLLLVKVGGPEACWVSRPKPSTFQNTSPLFEAEFQRLEARIRQTVTANAGAEVHDVGQIQIQGRLWIWTELSRRTIDLSVLTPEAAVEMRDAFDGARAWEFGTTEGGQGITVSCYVLKRRSAAEAELQEQLRRSGADFAAILNRISIRGQ